MPEVFTCNPVAERNSDIMYSAKFGGCTFGVIFNRGSAYIQWYGICQVIGRASLVWHKCAGNSTWQLEMAAGPELNEAMGIPRFSTPKWRRPSHLPWLAINLDPALVKRDRRGLETSMALGLFICLSHAILEQVERLADPVTGLFPPQKNLELKFTFPVFDQVPCKPRARHQSQSPTREKSISGKAITRV